MEFSMESKIFSLPQRKFSLRRWNKWHKWEILEWNGEWNVPSAISRSTSPPGHSLTSISQFSDEKGSYNDSIPPVVRRMQRKPKKGVLSTLIKSVRKRPFLTKSLLFLVLGRYRFVIGLFFLISDCKLRSCFSPYFTLWPFDCRLRLL